MAVAQQTISIINLSVSAASVIQQAKRMLRIILSGLLLGPTIFFHINKRHDFGRKKNTEQKMCIFIFSTTFVLNISHYKGNEVRYCHTCS